MAAGKPMLGAISGETVEVIRSKLLLLMMNKELLIVKVNLLFQNIIKIRNGTSNKRLLQ